MSGNAISSAEAQRKPRQQVTPRHNWNLSEADHREKRSRPPALSRGCVALGTDQPHLVAGAAIAVLVPDPGDRGQVDGVV